jgi:hypothetical protein
MPKADDDNKPKEWTPDQPLEDEEDEKEVQRRARANARLNHLTEQITKPKAPKGKEGRRSLFAV